MADRRRRPPPARVLMVTKGLGRGGAERLVVDTARRLDRSRFAVEVAYVLPWKSALVGDLEQAGIPVHLLTEGAGVVPWAWRLRQLVLERGVDIVHTHNPHTAAIARGALLGAGPALVHTEHNVWDRYRTGTRLANRVTYRRNDVVIAVSGAVARSAGRRQGPPPIEVVHHGPDLGRIHRGPAARQAARRRLGVGDDALVVGTVGNLTAKKDHHGLLDAFALTRSRAAGAHLVVVGSGPLDGALRDHATSLGLDPSRIFLGSRDDVPEILPGFDVFVLSSRHEGLPIALVEAMAAEVACVATAVGGIPELVRDQVDGVLVAPGDPPALAAALDRLLEDPDTRVAMGAAARRSPDLPTLDQAVDRIQDLYEQVTCAVPQVAALDPGARPAW